MEATRVRRPGATMVLLLGLFVLLNIGDLVSTYVALGIGMREGNPLMSTLLAHYGFAALIVYKTAVVTVVGGGVLLLQHFHPRLAHVTLWVCNALVLAAVVLNLLQYKAS